MTYYYKQLFAEEQTEEQAEEPEKKYTDADVNRIVNEKFAKFQSKYEKDLAEQVEQAQKLAAMNEQERAEAERDALKKELAELKRANTLSEMGNTARKMLAEASVSVPDELLNVLVTDDAEATKTNVESFTTLFKEAVQAEVTKQIAGKTPVRGTGSANLTKEEILKVKDRNERQRLINEHIELFI